MSHTTPDFSSMFQAIEAMADVPLGPRFHPLPQGTFCAASLTAWMERVNAAQVPAVPAEVVATLEVDALLHYDSPDAPATKKAMAALEQLNAAVDEHTMLRWDCCASDGVKFSLGEGTLPSVNERQLSPSDMRAFDILFAFPSDQVAVVRRPWVAADTLEGYPVEFRVFVENGEVVAVANYYLQRPLPNTEAVRRAARQAVRHSQAILAAVRAQCAVPAMPHQPNPEKVAATLDFLVTPEQDVVFLEAGPGHYFGAHPCAFLNPDGRSVAPLTGLCLASGKPAISLAELGD